MTDIYVPFDPSGALSFAHCQQRCQEGLLFLRQATSLLKNVIDLEMSRIPGCTKDWVWCTDPECKYNEYLWQAVDGEHRGAKFKIKWVDVGEVWLVGFSCGLCRLTPGNHN